MKKKRIISILEYVFVLCLVLFVFLNNTHEVSFHPDESQWIATSVCFDALLAGDFTSDVWGFSYWTLTQPPGTRYVIGLGRLAGGIPASAVNTAWDFFVDDRENAEAGALPSDELLMWSRLPMKILASLSILIGFNILRNIGGRIPGYIWVTLCLQSDYFLLHLRRAMSEAPLLFFIALILLAAFWILKFARREHSKQQEAGDPLPTSRRLFVYFAALGVLIGLAATMKLNGFAAIAAGALLAGLVAYRYKQSKTMPLLYTLILIWVVVIFAEAAFFAVNPFLWKEPFTRQSTLFFQRFYEMNLQQHEYVDAVIQGFSNRIRIVGGAVFNQYASLQFFGATWFNLAFTLAGLAYIMTQWVNLVRGRTYKPAAIVILIVALATAGPSLLTPLDWDRYYLLPVFFSTMMICIGLWWASSLAYHYIRRRLAEKACESVK